MNANAAALHADALVWDQHGCLPLHPDEDAVDELELYRRAGVDLVSINVGMDFTPTIDAFKVLAAFRRGLLARPDRYLIASGVADVRAIPGANFVRVASGVWRKGTSRAMDLTGQLSNLSESLQKLLAVHACCSGR